MNNKLDTFNDSEAKCKHCNKYYEILDWDSPIKDRGLGRSIKSYTFKCNECSKKEMIERQKHREEKSPNILPLYPVEQSLLQEGLPGGSINHYYSGRNIIDHYTADKITKAGFFYRNERNEQA
jgi:hypothetical protein